MNDSPYDLSSSDETSIEEDQTQDEGPRFGAVDIVEAFTAMRHEWRGQVKESRDLAEQIQAAAATLKDLETKLLNREKEIVDDPSESARLAYLIAETDHQLTRAVRAIEQAETNRKLRAGAEAGAVEQCAAGMNALARWFARPLVAILREQRRAQETPAENPASEGLNLVLARLRRSMKEHNIERVETEGQPFDANTMNAIGTMNSSEHPSGHVAEQLSPGYRWRGQVLRFADVRVAD